MNAPSFYFYFKGELNPEKKISAKSFVTSYYYN